MQRCPIQGCGRQFQNQLTMLQHVKRRHPVQSEKIKQKTTNQMLEKQNRITQQMNKLPKMQKIIQMSKQKKTLQFQRRSSSKKKAEINSSILGQNRQSIKISDIISESRQIVDENSNTRKLIKRPSLSKKNSEQNESKLPIINQKSKKLKLETLKSQFNNTVTASQKFFQKSNFSEKTAQNSNQNQMYSTAPNFHSQMNKKMQLLRSRSKGKDKQQTLTSQKQQSNDLSTIQTKDVIVRKKLSSSNLQMFKTLQITKPQQKSRPLQRPIKKLLERGSKKDRLSLQNNQTSVFLISQPHESLQETQLLSQSVYIQKNNQEPVNFEKSLKFPSKQNKSNNNRFAKKQKSPQTQVYKTISIDNQVWNERTVTIRNKNIQFFSIPSNAETEYLFLINCQIKNMDLNQCYSLIEISLNNNLIENLNFLQETLNGGYQNLEALYLDHNNLQSLESLPTYLALRKLSLTFNKIQSLDEVLKVLSKFSHLQQLDFSFNPIRKQPNYKYAVLSVCKNLKKLDGMLITKYDRQLANQYSKMYHEYLNIIPLSNNRPQSSKDKIRPSTAVSMNYQQQELDQSSLFSQLSDQQLEKQIKQLQKMIKHTKQQYEIIKQENQTLQQQISTYEPDLSLQQAKQQEFNPKIYKKLCKQVEELQLLNFMQYASQKQLQELLNKKAKQKGISLEMLMAN